MPLLPSSSAPSPPLRGIPVLEDSLKDAATDRERTNIQIALANGYFVQNNYARMYDVPSALLKQVPESKLAFTYTVMSLMALGRYDEASALTDDRLKLSRTIAMLTG